MLIKYNINPPPPPHTHTQVKSVVLVNCGGSINLLELLQPEQDSVTFYVVDSRRPYELDNVYSQDQVQLVVREGEELELPAFEEVYNSDMVCGWCGWVVCVWVVR